MRRNIVIRLRYYLNLTLNFYDVGVKLQTEVRRKNNFIKIILPNLPHTFTYFKIKRTINIK